MGSESKLVAQLRARRRSVEAEIKRVQAESSADNIRAATNDGYLTALEIELSFLISVLEG